MHIRIRLSRSTVKDLYSRLQHAYQHDDVRLVRRTTVLIDLLLLHNVGFSFQKARFVSDHLDAATRLAWLEHKWPTIVRAATRRQGLILFEDEASFAPWGSLSDTWARRGRQPEVPTSGKRKGYKVFGAIEYFSGQLFY